MPKPLHEKRIIALKLRKEGRSYSEIKEVLRVSKSTLSLWLRDLPLSAERINELRAFSEKRIERFRITMAAKREARISTVREKEKNRLLPLSDKELLIAGLFLYLGEGGKTNRFGISLSNSNPEVVQFFVYWLQKSFKVPREKLKVRLHIYSEMDASAEISYWSTKLNIPASQFSKPMVKQTTLRGLTFKGFGHGTCNVIVGGRDYFETITQGISVITDDCLKRSLTDRSLV